MPFINTEKLSTQSNAIIGHQDLRLMSLSAPIGLTYNPAPTWCYLRLTGQKDHSTGKNTTTGASPLVYMNEQLMLWQL